MKRVPNSKRGRWPSPRASTRIRHIWRSIPKARFPTLVIDGRPLTEVAGILFYLAKRFPEAGLLPSDEIEGVAQVVSWMSYIAATIHPARGRGAEIAVPVFAVAERWLGGREWTVGNRMSIADIHLFRLFWRFKRGDEEPASQFAGLMAITIG